VISNPALNLEADKDWTLIGNHFIEKIIFECSIAGHLIKSKKANLSLKILLGKWNNLVQGAAPAVFQES